MKLQGTINNMKLTLAKGGSQLHDVKNKVCHDHQCTLGWTHRHTHTHMSHDPVRPHMLH